MDEFVYPELNIKFDKHEIFEFCSELKKFYVIITRTKTFLVFYENNLNYERNSFYSFMESGEVNLISKEDYDNNSQSQFLENINKYFNDINLKVKSPYELRILGNEEFNEGHYSRAYYLYNTSGNELLSTISEIFYNEENINERINTYDENSPELKKLSQNIVKNAIKILNKHEENNLNNIIPNDPNKINIDFIIKQIVKIIGKNFIFLEKYDEAIELYEKYGKYEEKAFVYLNHKKDYSKAFEIFNSLGDYKYALESLKGLKNVKKIIDYCNEYYIVSYLGIIEYNNIYFEYTNKFFKRYNIERKKINEEKYLDIIGKIIKNRLVYKNIIKNYFITYLNQINIFQRNMVSNNEQISNISQEQIEDLKEELNLNEETIHFINTYYFNILENIIIELIKLFPELVICNKGLNNNSAEKHFRRKLFIRLLQYERGYKKIYFDYNNNKKGGFDKKENLYHKLEIVLKYFMNTSEYSKEKFIRYIYPFIISNGFFNLKLDNFSLYTQNELSKIKLFYDLSMNNYSLLDNLEENEELERIISNDNDFKLYYLSYILRIGITDFIIYKNDTILTEYLSVVDLPFNRLTHLIYILITNSTIDFKSIKDDVKKFTDFLLNSKKEIININEITELLDIGCSLSLFLITIYFNYEYNISIKFDKESLHELLQNLFKLSNIICSQNYLETISYNKKLILFSLFSVFNISPFPYNDKILDKKIFKIFNYINGCLLNYNSILNSENFFNVKNHFNAKYFDIFSEENNDLFKDNYFKMFNIEGNNIIINYNTVTTLFKLILSGLIKYIEIFLNNIEFKIFSSDDDKYIPSSNDSSILYYYNCLNFYFIEAKKEKDEMPLPRKNSLENFIRGINYNFFKRRYVFPNIKKNENYRYFYLINYFKDLMLFDRIDYEVIYSFLINYDKKHNDINAYLLIFLLKEKWNINFKFIKEYSFANDSSLYYGKLKTCLGYILNGRSNIFISLIILRRIFPDILLLIEHYLKNYDKNWENFIKKEDIDNKKVIKILIHEYENCFDETKKITIFDELIDNKDNKSIIQSIIEDYFKALNKSMQRFSEYGYSFRNDEFLWKEKNIQNKEINLKGKVKFKYPKKLMKYNNKLIKIAKKCKIKNRIMKKIYLNQKVLNKEQKNENENQKKESDNENKEDKNIDQKEEKDEEEEYENEEAENDEGEKSKNIKVKNNIINHFNQLFYEKSINKIIGKKEDYYLIEIIGLLENAYKENYKELKGIDNEYYYLFEITFYCIYLNLIEVYYQNTNVSNKEINSIFKLIEGFMKKYEQYSLYINFIDEEGSKTFIKNKYDKLFNYLPSFIKLYPKTYKSTYKLRKYLLKNKLFKYKEDEYIDIIEKNVEFVNNEKVNSSPKENEIEALKISFSENNHFYKDIKAKEVKNFYEKFDYDKKDINQRNKYFGNLVKDYLNIVEN